MSQSKSRPDEVSNVKQDNMLIQMTNETHHPTSSLTLFAHSFINPFILTTIPLSLIEPVQEEGTSDTTESSTESRPVKDLSAEERRQRRLWRNRIAAKECRKKKKMYIEDLKTKIQQLQEHNDSLRKEAAELKEKLSFFDSEETFKLIKEVEVLNAKLRITK